MQALRMPEKQISIGSQEFSEAVNHFYLSFPFKIDKDVAAENQVEGAINRIGYLSKIHPLKADDVPEFVGRLDFAFFRAEAPQKKPSLIVNRHIRESLGRPNASRSAG